MDSSEYHVAKIYCEINHHLANVEGMHDSFTALYVTITVSVQSHSNKITISLIY